MKIDLQSIDREQFMVHEHEFVGEKVYLVQPQHIGAKYTPQNMIFRSSVWNAQGEPVSLSFPKFFNWGEHPELTPLPTSLKGARLVEKIDGSTLILSHYKGQNMLRTRGTIDALGMKNGHEILELRQKYPFLEDDSWTDNPNFNVSLLFEWTSPLNVIVIKYKEPEIYLIGAVNHNDYSLFSQDELDDLAKTLGVKRPNLFDFAHIDEMLVAIDKLKGQEGTCVYFGKNHQKILKVKSDWYRTLHAAKSELASEKNFVDVFFISEAENYQEFYNYIVDKFDFETAEQYRGEISRIADAYKETKKIIAHMVTFVSPLFERTRKDAAELILSSYGKTNRASFCFKILDGKDLTKDDKKKLLFQILG